MPARIATESTAMPKEPIVKRIARPSSSATPTRHATSEPARHATVDSVASETAIAVRENPSACSVPTSRTR